jgi:hypothetical protein
MLLSGMAKKTARADARPALHKISVSLYQPDLDKIDEIKIFMLKRGVRNIGDSEAIRLAVRCADITDALLAAHEKMGTEDRRRKV